MQNVDFDKENENPQHFPSNPATISEHSKNNHDSTSLSIDDNDNEDDVINSDNLSKSTAEEDPSTSAGGGATRPKFSFSSDYLPSRHFSSSFATASSSSLYNYNLPLSSSVSSAFTVLNNHYGSSSSFIAKPNAIVHPIRRSEDTALPKNPNVLGRDLRITGYPPNAGLSVTHPQYGRDIQNFAEELKRKLSSLGATVGSRELGLSKFKNSSQNVSAKGTRHVGVVSVWIGMS